MFLISLYCMEKNNFKKWLLPLSITTLTLGVILAPQLGQANMNMEEMHNIESFYSDGDVVDNNDNVKATKKQDDETLLLLDSQNLAEDLDMIEKVDNKEVFINTEDANVFSFDKESNTKTDEKVDIFTKCTLTGFNDEYASIKYKDKNMFVDKNHISENRNNIFRTVDIEMRFLDDETKLFSTPSKDAEHIDSETNESVGLLGFNEKGFAKVDYKGEVLYVQTENLKEEKAKTGTDQLIITKKGSEEQPEQSTTKKTNKKAKKTKKIKIKPISADGKMKTVPNHRNFKAYMDWRKITLRSSLQWKLQQNAYTENGFRMYNGRYMIALGSHWGRVGEEVTIVLENGKKLDCIIGDQKADAHTDANNMFHLSDGSFIEFIVDTSSLARPIKRMGNCSYATHTNLRPRAVGIIK